GRGDGPARQNGEGQTDVLAARGIDTRRAAARNLLPLGELPELLVGRGRIVHYRQGVEVAAVGGGRPPPVVEQRAGRPGCWGVRLRGAAGARGAWAGYPEHPRAGVVGVVSSGHAPT